MGTRMSGRLPHTYSLRDWGKGAMAAWSTVAVAASNFRGAFKWWLLLQAGASKGGATVRAAAERRRDNRKLPFAGIIQIRFRGCFSPAPRNAIGRTPSVCCLLAARQL